MSCHALEVDFATKGGGDGCLGQDLQIFVAKLTIFYLLIESGRK